jgi:hypothetical protein
MRRESVIVLVLAIIMLATPLVSAVPLKEKNNDKFQTFGTQGTFSLFDIVNGDHQFIPSFDKVNKMVTRYEENMLTYTITVGSKTYYLGSDFAYTGNTVEVLFDPIFGDPGKTIVLGSRYEEIFVDYMFDFSAYPGGIEGTLNMHAAYTNGNGFTRSLSGTGDLQNVEVKEIGLEGSFDPNTFMETVNHAGLVHGWPE